MLWGRGRSLLSYVVVVWHYCIHGGGGISEIVFEDYCFRRIYKILGFQGEFLGMVAASVREEAWGQSRHSREKTRRCKSTTSQKTAGRKGNICNSQGSA